MFKTVECGEKDIGLVAGPPRPFIALASYQGSGNTWTRVLLDQMTGIYTGSEYNDSMSNNVLKGSTVCPFSKVFIIKTHNKTDTGVGNKCGQKQLNYKSAIYIVRNPYHAVLAEFNRLNAGKVSVVSLQTFETSAWLNDSNRMVAEWNQHLTYWLTTFGKPAHVLVYEELVKNTLWELYKTSKFINFPVSYKTMWCIKYNTDSQITFRRVKPDWFRPENLYNQSQNRLFNELINDIINKLGKYPGLQTYLENYLLEI